MHIFSAVSGSGGLEEKRPLELPLPVALQDRGPLPRSCLLNLRPYPGQTRFPHPCLLKNSSIMYSDPRDSDVESCSILRTCKTTAGWNMQISGLILLYSLATLSFWALKAGG